MHSRCARAGLTRHALETGPSWSMRSDQIEETEELERDKNFALVIKSSLWEEIFVDGVNSTSL